MFQLYSSLTLKIKMMYKSKENVALFVNVCV